MAQTAPTSINKLALITGTLGPLVVVLLTILGGASFPNYSHASQFISELGASAAPNGRIISLAGFLPAGALIIAFAIFACRSLPRSGANTIGRVITSGMTRFTDRPHYLSLRQPLLARRSDIKD